MTTIGSICIAGYHFGLQNDTNLQLVFETGFEDFFTSVGPHIDRQLIFKQGFIDFANSTSCYQAKANKQLLWEIRDTANGRWFLVYHPETGELQQQAQYNPIKHTWNIHCEAQEFQDESVLNPLAYPMAPLLWYVLTTEEPLLLVHASGLTDGKKGRLFAGFSGVGKSTMAGIWERNGAQVINDDRLLLKLEADGTWHMYNTPMYYQASPKSAALQHIYFPFHSPTNTFEKLSGAKAIAQLLAFTIHHGYDAQHVLHHSNIAEQLLQTITAAKLGVVPTNDIIDFIQANEQSAT
jgi:hypothetical protein